MTGVPLAAVSVDYVPAVAGLHVLVIGINYAPEVTGIAPYTTAMAEDLAAHGATVDAFVGLPHYPEWRVHHGYRHRARRSVEQLNGVTVHRFRHHVPETMTAIKRGRYEATFLLSVLREEHHLHKPDVIIAVVPALGGAVAAARIAKRHGIPFGVIVQDLMGKAAAQSGMSGGGSVAGMVGRAERYALRRAAGVAAISAPIARAIEGYGVAANRIVHLPNYTHIAIDHTDRDEARARLGWPTDRLIAVHTGNMGLKQDLENVVRAAQLADDKGAQVEFRLIGDGNQRSQLEDAGRSIERLVFEGSVSSDEYPLILRAADILLVNERASVDDMSLPSKLTSYLAAGRPVVAAVPPHGATAGMVEESRGGIVVAPDDPMALFDAVLSLEQVPDQRDRLGAHGLAYANANLMRRAGLASTRRFVASVTSAVDRVEWRPASIPSPRRVRP